MLAARHIATPAGASVSQLVLRKQRNEVPENRRNSLHKGLLQTSVSLVLHTGLLPSPLIFGRAAVRSSLVRRAGRNQECNRLREALQPLTRRCDPRLR